MPEFGELLQRVALATEAAASAATGAFDVEGLVVDCSTGTMTLVKYAYGISRVFTFQLS